MHFFFFSAKKKKIDGQKQPKQIKTARYYRNN